MCKLSNKTLYNLLQVAFASIHLALLIACIIIATKNDVVPFYEIEIGNDLHVLAFPIYASIVTHIIGVLGHLLFYWLSDSIINDISQKYSNGYRYIFQFLTDGSSLVGISMVYGVAQIEVIGALVVIYMSTIVLTYLQDEYLRSSSYNPPISPNTFGLPIYVALILFLASQSLHHITTVDERRAALVTIIALAQTIAMFLIQKFHIKNELGSPKYVESQNDEDEDEDDDIKLNLTIDKQLDSDLASLHRGIKYEAAHYLNSLFFTITVTWVVLTITRNGLTLV